MPAVKKTVSAKIAGGNSGRKKLCPENELKFKSASWEEFKIPDHIAAFPEALSEWYSRLPSLVESGAVRLEDSACFALYCFYYGVIKRDASKWLNAGGESVYSTVAGNSIQQPRLGVIGTAHKMLLVAMKELGMTPASRGRIGVTPSNSESNDFSDAGL